MKLLSAIFYFLRLIFYKAVSSTNKSEVTHF